MIMAQLVITLIIVAVATGITAYRIIRWFSKPLSKCDSCALKSVGCGPGKGVTKLPS